MISLAKKDSNFYIFTSIPSVGNNLAARLIAELGDISRFSKPEQINAFTIAQAPGIGITSIPSSIAFFITSSPGSHIPGVPASDTNAIFSPFFNFSVFHF